MIFPTAAAKSLQSLSDSVRPHRQQPTRLPCPWDSPGKNTGVGCHFLLQSMKVKSESEVAQSCPTLRGPHGLQPSRLLRPWDLPGKSTGVGCHCLLQGKLSEQYMGTFCTILATFLYILDYSKINSLFTNKMERNIPSKFSVTLLCQIQSLLEVERNFEAITP